VGITQWWRAKLADGGVVQWVSPRESRGGKILGKMEGGEMGTTSMLKPLMWKLLLNEQKLIQFIK
jgi:hypothetical protein